jgi:hypothetical protein
LRPAACCCCLLLAAACCCTQRHAVCCLLLPPAACYLLLLLAAARCCLLQPTAATVATAVDLVPGLAGPHVVFRALSPYGISPSVLPLAASLHAPLPLPSAHGPPGPR